MGKAMKIAKVTISMRKKGKTPRMISPREESGTTLFKTKMFRAKGGVMRAISKSSSSELAAYFLTRDISDGVLQTKPSQSIRERFSCFLVPSHSLIVAVKHLIQMRKDALPHGRAIYRR